MNTPVLDTFRTDTVKIDTLKGIRPAKPLITLGYTTWEILLVIGFGLLVLLFCLALVWRYHKKKGIGMIFTRAPNPLQKALNSLALLDQAQQSAAPLDSRSYYDALSWVLRAFLQEVYKIDTRQSTSRQIMLSSPLSQLPDEHKMGISHFLKQADRLKFSGEIPVDVVTTDQKRLVELLGALFSNANTRKGERHD